MCVYSGCAMADRESLLLEAQACVGSDHMFKECFRANPLWGEPCAGINAGMLMSFAQVLPEAQ